MPKKTKESDNALENIKNYLLSSIRKDKKEKSDKKSSDIKEKKKSKSKEAVISKTTAKKNTKTSAQAKKSTKSKVSKKEVTSKKSDSSNVNSEKKVSSTSSPTLKNKNTNNQVFSAEYYDLPYKYNKTTVKILAQTPTTLFVYWEISDEDRERLKNQFGTYFFEITKPVLIIHNITMNYSFEIDINDFANSWYFHVNDSNCEYQIELGRRPIPVNYNYMPQYDIEKDGPINPIDTSYVYISSSNNLEAPNDHVLFNNTNKIYFRNVKTNQIIEKDIKDFPFFVKDNEFVYVYELYKNLYKDEIINGRFDRMNPSSGNPSSGNLSSW